MKRFSAQYIITNSTPTLKRAVVTTEDDGTIISVADTSGELKENHSLEFHNGIIIPGFVNCHCHLELSHLRGSVPQGSGLGPFVGQINNTRSAESEVIISSARSADNYMYREGISLCGDICNTSDTFGIKKESRIKYINLVEVFGIDPEKASRRMDIVTQVSEASEKMNIKWSLVPHSAYSVSLTLLRLLRNKSENNKVTSVHFLETASEKEFLENNTGVLMESYKQSKFVPERLETVQNHIDAVLREITPAGNLILVHNTFADRNTVKALKKRENLYWCLCPNSNEYIEKVIPPATLLAGEGCVIVIGTDSLASNTKLSILSELITLQMNFPLLSIEDLVGWATVNGAKALGEENTFGTIEPGKKPGLLLLQNVDLVNMKLLPESSVTRLI